MPSNPWFDEIKRSALSRYPALLQQWFPNGHVEGQEFVVGSLEGEKGKSLKINLATGHWADFAAGPSGGDAIALYAALRKISYKDAGKELGRILQVESSLQNATNLWAAIAPIPDDAPFEADGRPKLPASRQGNMPAAMWCYRDEKGAQLCWRVRYDRPDGGKDIFPLTYCEHARNHERGWQWRDLPAPRPLYGLEYIAARQDAPVLVVEGEKTADAARLLLPDWCVVTWAGGAKRVSSAQTQWKPLKERAGRIVLWPDADRDGRRAMAELGEYLGTSRVQCVVPDPAWNQGWDLADAAAERWTGDRVMTYLETHIAKPMFERPLSRRATVQIPAGDLAEQTQAVWDAVQEANSPPELFQSELGLTIIDRDLFANYLRKEADIATLANWLTKRIAFTRLTPDGIRKCAPNVKLLTNLIAESNPPLPNLVRLCDVPIYAPSGKLVHEIGYEAESGLFYGPSHDFEIEVGGNEVPDAASLRSALDLLFDLIDDFPFVADCDRAHAVAFALLPILRLTIKGRTPMFRFEAPQPGSGKSLLMRLLSRQLTCSSVSDISPTRDDEEWRKRITAALRDDPDAVLIDNALEIESAQLKKVLTDDIWADRALGLNSIVRYPVRCVWGVSLNNPSISAEIMRRSLRVRLDARSEHPELRNNFRHKNIEEYAAQNRPALVKALITIAEYGMHYGGDGMNLPTLGGYEPCCRKLGAILNAVGIGGFLDDRDDSGVRSTEEMAFAAFVAKWGARYREEWCYSTTTLLPLAESVEDLELGRRDTERGKSTALGLLLRRHRDATIGEWRIAAYKTDDHGSKWKLAHA